MSKEKFSSDAIAVTQACINRMEHDSGLRFTYADDVTALIEGLLRKGYGYQHIESVIDFRHRQLEDAGDIAELFTPKVIFGKSFAEYYDKAYNARHSNERKIHRMQARQAEIERSIADADHFITDVKIGNADITINQIIVAYSKLGCVTLESVIDQHRVIVLADMVRDLSKLSPTSDFYASKVPQYLLGFCTGHFTDRCGQCSLFTWERLEHRVIDGRNEIINTHIFDTCPYKGMVPRPQESRPHDRSEGTCNSVMFNGGSQAQVTS
jgi:hypothetical protein